MAAVAPRRRPSVTGLFRVCPVSMEKKLEKEMNDTWTQRKKRERERERQRISGEAVSRADDIELVL